jgi:outer membrane protein assembly factor BamB
MRAICRFTNQADPESDELCLATADAIGDLRVLGGAAGEVSFTGALPVAAGGGSGSIFLASFTPIADQSRWPGTVDHFVAPLPVIENDDGSLVPDRGRRCSDPEERSCLAWDAGAELLDQAPDTTEVASDRRIGAAAFERRVTYTRAAAGDAVPRAISAFDYSDADTVADERDLWQGMGIAFVVGDAASEQAARSIARHVIRRTLAQRTATVTDAAGASQSISFVLGDVFHADPVLVGGPSNFFYLANDLEGNGRSCTTTIRPNRGYRCFFERERRRRRVLLAPSNDGQLHAFDAGFFRGSVEDRRLVGRFDSGGGRELFAHIPRPMLRHTRDQVTFEHAPGLDGPLTVDDVFIDPVHSGAPNASDREWRTVAIGTYREGGRGLYALDLTHPDPVQTRSVRDFAGRADVEFVPVAASSAAPSCTALQHPLPAGCPRPYPMALWEFADPDLGLSWSKVNTGRVRVRSAGQSAPVARFVAVFGGGLDPADASLGQHLYMVDVETGTTLWKRAVTGPVPSEPAAVDTDRDGFLDTLYVGTAAGYLYKVDLAAPGELDPSTGRVDDTRQWAPFRIFDTGGREIFFRPTVVFDASTGRYAIGFGTGDRSDLWSRRPGRSGRFYLIADPGFAAGVGEIATGPLTESSFHRIAVGSAASGGNFLTTPVDGNLAGWVLELGEEERVVTDALAVSGFLSFTTFEPERPDLCSFGGSGHVYALLAANGDAAGGAGAERAIAIEGIAGRATVTAAGWIEPASNGGSDPFAAPRISELRASLRDLFPSDCRFGAFSLDVSTTTSGREMVPLARIPVCVARRNWTELF